MAKEKKVEQITDMEVDFAQWYTDICRKAELVEYASVKGFTILRPYGYAIWENIQRIMDAEFKKTGHENVAMPVLIPESLLKKEGELVNGFAPEVAWVTMGGSEKLEERLAFRPTSETMFCDHWSKSTSISVICSTFFSFAISVHPFGNTFSVNSFILSHLSSVCT